MISFYPGPSQIYPQVKDFMIEAADTGILSVNHRSEEFVDLSKKCQQLMRQKLGIPTNYQIFYCSSATECWEIISESFLSAFSLHIFNGAFGEKWFEYRKKIMPNAMGIPFHYQRDLGMNQLRKLVKPEIKPELVCVTQNETSNCTQIKNKKLRKLRKHFNESLICVDATSSMAGIKFDWHLADIWFSSVQKCFGLPAGMSIMVCSPNAVEKALELNHNQHYNSLVSMVDKMKAYQTTHTPNVLNIFLLKKVMEMVEPIETLSKKMKERSRMLNKFFIDKGYRLLVENSSVRSYTVMGVKGEAGKIAQIKKDAKSAGLLLGNGYGNWKQNTFRIANFPALSDANFEELKDFFSNYKM